MSVGAVGGGSAAALQQLQQQLQQDQRALAADQKAKADQQALQLDQLRVEADQSAIATAQQTAALAAQQKAGSPVTQASSVQGAEGGRSATAPAPVVRSSGDTADGSWYL